MRVSPPGSRGSAVATRVGWASSNRQGNWSGCCGGQPEPVPRDPPRGVVAMRSAVALIMFNRPKLTARVFEAIAAARPPKLLLIADGPRADRPDDSWKCAATRDVVRHVDWDCEVLTNFSDVNLGCGRR